MTEILLFHHALGLTDGVRWFAGRLTPAGHEVHTPDLFAGRTFATIEEGVTHAQPALPVDHFAPRWPEAVSLDLHLKSADPWGEEDPPVAWRLAGEVAELYEYPGDQHLFTEHGHPDFDADATELVLARTLESLARL